jgi:hypothetical protein
MVRVSGLFTAMGSPILQSFCHTLLRISSYIPLIVVTYWGLYFLGSILLTGYMPEYSDVMMPIYIFVSVFFGPQVLLWIEFILVSYILFTVLFVYLYYELRGTDDCNDKVAPPVSNRRNAAIHNV